MISNSNKRENKALNIFVITNIISAAFDKAWYDNDDDSNDGNNDGNDNENIDKCRTLRKPKSR